MQITNQKYFQKSTGLALSFSIFRLRKFMTNLIAAIGQQHLLKLVLKLRFDIKGWINLVDLYVIYCPSLRSS